MKTRLAIVFVVVAGTVGGATMLLQTDRADMEVTATPQLLESEAVRLPPEAAADQAKKDEPDSEIPGQIETAMIADASRAYLALAHYPEYSMPISEDQEQAYLGNEFSPVTVEALGNTLAVSLNKYRFTVGDTVEALLVKKGPSITPESLSATMSKRGGDSEESVSFAEIESGSFYAEFSTESSDPGEYVLKIEIPLDGELVTHVSTFEVDPLLATLKGQGTPDVSNNNLELPVELEIHDSGDYAFTASLAIDGQLTGLLSEEKTVSSGSQTITFKAHGSLIASYENMETATLIRLGLRKLPPLPGDVTLFGYLDESLTFDVPSNANNLKDEPNNSPQVAQRREFFERLANPDKE